MVCLRSCSHSNVKFLVHSRCSVVVAEYEAVEAMWKYRSHHSVVICRTAVDWWQASLQCVCMCVCRLGGSLDKALLLDTQDQVSTAIWLDFEIICGNREQRRGWGGTVLWGAPDWWWTRMPECLWVGAGREWGYCSGRVGDLNILFIYIWWNWVSDNLYHRVERQN